MIFINCQNEALIQTKDKTRIDVSSSFVSGDAITDILIKPNDDTSYISVFNADQSLWYLDWAYEDEGDQTITVQATDDTDTVTAEFTITVISESEDNLYSTDAEIFAIEGELKKYMPEGKNSYKNLHREAQSRIVNYLDKKRLWNSDGTPYAKNQINLYGMLQKWSLYETILMIYTDLTISIGDKFTEKVSEYKALRNYERDRAQIRIDKDNSGTIDAGEIQDLKSFRMIRR